MTQTTHGANRRAPTPEPRPPQSWRKAWVLAIAGVAVVLGALVAVVALWPEGEEAAPQATAPPATSTVPPSAPIVPPTAAATVTPGPHPAALSWAPAAAPPRGQVLAVTSADAGFLAAVHTTDGVEFWSSPRGDAWTLLSTGSGLFGPRHQVLGLDHGPAGFVARVFDPGLDFEEGADWVWTSVDGVTWHRSRLIPDVAEIDSPYVIQESFVGHVVSGPRGFLAVGDGGFGPDLDLIAAEFAPGYDAEDVYAVDAEMRPDGAVLIVGFGDEEPLEIPFAELGIAPGDLAGIFEGEGPGGSGPGLFFWWSTDGVTWEQVESSGLPEDWVSTMYVLALGADDGFYLIGPMWDPDDPEGPPILGGFHSTDGRDWTPLSLEGPGRVWARSVTAGGGMFVIVAEGELGVEAWKSADGRSWSRLSDDLFDVGAEGAFAPREIHAGGAGFVASGGVDVEFSDEMPEPVIVKEGYAVTFLRDGALIVADEVTGDVLGVLDPDTARSETIAMVEDEARLAFVDVVSGDTLVVISHEEIDAAYEALFGMSDDAQAPQRMELLRYSIDGDAWTLDTYPSLYGEGTFSIASAVGEDVVVAVVGADLEDWQSGEDPREVPAARLWVGTPAPLPGR